MKATDSQRKFGSDGNGNPNYGREVVDLFSLKKQSLTRSWPLDSRGCFEQGIKWDAPLDLDFGLDFWRIPDLVQPLAHRLFGLAVNPIANYDSKIDKITCNRNQEV